MPVRFFRCPYCVFESQDEQEVIKHEKTHARIVLCKKVHKKNEIDCVMNVLEKHDAEGDPLCELTFTWKALVTNKETARIMSSVFQVSKDAMEEVFK